MSDLTSAIGRAAHTLRSGGLVAFPTETVYGLGANALDARAVARVFEVKQRPLHNPLIVHIPHADLLSDYAQAIPAAARRLARHFWPGPLTLVLARQPVIADIVSAGLSTVGLRVPNHPVALRLLNEAQVPIAAPSANAYTKLSPTCATHVRSSLPGIECLLDGGHCPIGIESTIIGFDSHERPRILRYGGLPLEAIESCIGPVLEASSPTHTPQAPGMLPSHYKPKTQILWERPTGEALRCGLIALTAAPDGQRYVAREFLSPTGDLHEAAANFYAALHRLDGLGLDRIVARRFPDEGLGKALNDRLSRAAAR